MGAWGCGSFENDDALDWLGDFSDAPSIDAIRDALTKVANFNEGYLESPECGAAIAAAEIVAALKGSPGANLPDEAKDWVETQEKNVSPELIAMSVRAIDRIKLDSEMKELWEEDGDGSEWHSAVDDLRGRLLAEPV